MTDRELLELAAKAAGIRPIAWGVQFDSYGWFCEPTGEHWNALTDDGDALRLAVKLRMNIRHYSITHEGPDRVGIDNGYGIYPVLYGADPYAATRRAIVRAAAEIGKAVQKPLAP